MRLETEYVRQKNRVRGCKDDILKAAGLGSLIEEYQRLYREWAVQS